MRNRGRPRAAVAAEPMTVTSVRSARYSTYAAPRRARSRCGLDCSVAGSIVRAAVSVVLANVVTVAAEWGQLLAIEGCAATVLTAVLVCLVAITDAVPAPRLRIAPAAIADPDLALCLLPETAVFGAGTTVLGAGAAGL